MNIHLQPEWTTFNGRKVTIDTIDHQHLSNVYWYNRIIWNVPVDAKFYVTIKSELENRFNGQILPYRPHVNFKEEIKMLEDKGMLFNVWTSERGFTEVKKRNIYFEGGWIGEIIEMQF